MAIVTCLGACGGTRVSCFRQALASLKVWDFFTLPGALLSLLGSCLLQGRRGHQEPKGRRVHKAPRARSSQLRTSSRPCLVVLEMVVENRPLLPCSEAWRPGMPRGS